MRECFADRWVLKFESRILYSLGADALAIEQHRAHFAEQ